MSDDGQVSYDATGQYAAYPPASLSSAYTGDRLRGRRVEGGATTYYFRSSVMGSAVVAEWQTGSAVFTGWNRGYVYGEGGGLLAIQQDGSVEWVHHDMLTKSQRLTNTAGMVTAALESDPWGGEAQSGYYGRVFTSNSSRQPQKYTSYIRDGAGGDDAQQRTYGAWWSRFSQPDPYDGSYSLADPQSFNRYAYVGNDPVNRVDPSGLAWLTTSTTFCVDSGGARTCETQEQYFWVDDSFFGGGSGGGQNPVPLPPTLPDPGDVPTLPPPQSVEVPLPDVDAGIKGLLGNPNCAGFVTNLINATATTANPAHSSNGLTLYGMISGVVFAQQVVNGQPVGGTVGGSISGRNATINISPARVSSLAGANLHRDTQIGYLMTGLHETIHHAGRNGYYSDSALAAAAFSLMTPAQRAANPLPRQEDFATVWDFIKANSGYWNAQLYEHCDPRKR